MTRPLAVRWLAHELPELRAGAKTTAHVELENAGKTAWRGDRFTVSYHWLDALGNAIVWDGLRTAVVAEPGDVAALDVAIRAPIPPGRYRLAIDVVDEGRFWFGELGERTLDLDVDVLARIDDPKDAVAHLGDAVPTADWHERAFVAHREDYAVVGGSIDAHRNPALAAYAPGTGRVPSFPHPLVCPSIVNGVEVEWTEIAGLPAAIPPRDEPSLYDGRITARLPSDRRRE